MHAKVDWLSFTVPAPTSGAGHSAEVYSFIQRTLEEANCQPLLQLIGDAGGTPRAGRGHYGAGVYYEQFHISMWWGGIANHILVEIAGVGCECLREIEQLKPLLLAVHLRCTRLDIACDFETNTKPIEFVNGGYNARFKSRTSVTSVEGATEYIGSPKSERFSRVYRYSKPHPRSGLLRVEFVTRSAWAKAASLALVRSSLDNLVGKLGGSYGFKHTLWANLSLDAGKLANTRDEKGDASSIFWLSKQVRPALLRLHADGVINLHEWVDDLLAEIE